MACFVILENDPFELTFVDEPEDLRRAEFFPFSSFPMYSNFSPHPNYVYVTTPDGEPVAHLGQLDVLSSVIKKAYDKELRKIKAETGVAMSEMSPEQKKPAGDATLLLIRNSISPHAFASGQLPRLQLHEAIIRFGEDGMETEDLIVGDVTF